MAIIGDQDREFAATRYLILEVLPLPIKYQRRREANFYLRFFGRVMLWIDEAPLLQPAIDLACRYGLGGMDALHLAAAASVNAEFISAERPTKPLYGAYAQAGSIY